jgi:hypothetical protein
MLKVPKYRISPGKMDFLLLTPGLLWWSPLRAFAIPRRWEDLVHVPHEQQGVRLVYGWSSAFLSFW